MANIEISTLTRNNDGNTYIIKDANAIPRSGGAVLTGGEFSRNVDNSYLNINAGTSWDKGAQLQLFGKDWNDPGAFAIYATLDANTRSMFYGKHDGTLLWNGKNVAMQEDTVPRSGGAVMGGATKVAIARSTDSGELRLDGGTGWDHGSSLSCHGKDDTVDAGAFVLNASNGTSSHWLAGYPNGTLTWGGQPVQTSSDARLKQQISQIDDDLLTAWEDVNPVQFKYNDAVEEKGKDKARLHTGYVVQQIDDACKSHNVDVSKYGLYCHEEYPERTEEVTIENEDGTTSKETKVIEEASEHYSLRYTETLVVECAYLRRENTRLKTRLNSLESRLEQIEQSLK